MDPESVAFQPREDFWRFQSEMLRVQQNQVDLTDRVARLERKHDDDSRLKNVWGTSSPFPSVWAGPLSKQPTAEHFSNFDEHSSNLIGNLQLDADEEPRRLGTTSRANSVRFDETANHGHWAHASRSSLDLIPRTGSGMGGISLSERSYSHKSDGRQSSAGHSATSGRANSLTGFGPHALVEPPGLAPGLFILGSVPAIIRCWLSTNFKHDTLLYAAVCSGSYTSYLDLRLIKRLGFEDEIMKSADNTRKLKLPVYLPEAILVSMSSRSNSPAPQLPCLSIDFTVVENPEQDSKAIQIFLGSDMLRSRNADILLSSNQLVLYDDDRNKLQIPLVRPEDDRTFKSLFVTSGSMNSAVSQNVDEQPVDDGSATVEQLPIGSQVNGNGRTTSIDDGGSLGLQSIGQRPFLGLSTKGFETKDEQEPSPSSAALRSGASPAIWSNWRRDTDKSASMDWGSVGKPPSSTYQRRDTGIKVLKPSKPGSRGVSASASQSPSPAATGQSRFFDDGKRRTSTTGDDGGSAPQLKRAVSGEKAKENAKPRSANPVGGASAFAWLNSAGSK